MELTFRLMLIAGGISLLGVPLILGVVPPNPFYGFWPTKSTRVSPDIWYSANRISGAVTCCAGMVALALLALVRMSPGASFVPAILAFAGPFLLGALLSVLLTKRLRHAR